MAVLVVNETDLGRVRFVDGALRGVEYGERG